MTAWMTTFTGKQVDILNIKPEEIDIQDIAHHLALVNRFGGATRVPLSVAQHSVYVSRLCSPKQRLQGLLHDATEAYLGDVVHWLKKSSAFSDYRQIEHDLEIKIWQKFGCETRMSVDVHDADRIMCVFEALRLMPEIVWYEGYPKTITANNKKAIGHWTPWGWKTAEEVFLAEARVLGVRC